LAELRKVVTVALQPHVGDHVDVVIQHARPISEKNGFSAVIYTGRMPGESAEDYQARMPADDAFIVRKVLNAGATLNYVQLDDRSDQDGRYYVHKQLYKTLLLIASTAHRTGQRNRAPGLPAPERPPPAIHGGSLEARLAQVAPPPQTPALPAAMPELAVRHGAQKPAQSKFEPQPDLRQYFIDRMVEALGIDPAHYAGIGGETWSAAQAATDAFKLLQRTNLRLDQIIEAREIGAQKTVDRMHERLQSSPEAQAPLGSSMLESAYEDVLKNLSIIALLPGGPVERELRSVRARLEKQFESDLARPTPEEEHLLSLVRRLEDSIARNSRASAEDWRLVHAGFQGPFAVFANRGQRPGTG
jgi:hypothetical protein